MTDHAWSRIAGAIAMLAMLKERWPIDEGDARTHLIFVSDDRPEWEVPVRKAPILSSWGLPELKPRARKEIVKMEHLPGFGWFGFSAKMNVLLAYLEESQIPPEKTPKPAPLPPLPEIEPAPRAPHKAPSSAPKQAPPPEPETAIPPAPADPFDLLRRALPVLEKHERKLAAEVRRLLAATRENREDGEN